MLDRGQDDQGAGMRFVGAAEGIPPASRSYSDAKEVTKGRNVRGFDGRSITR